MSHRDSAPPGLQVASEPAYIVQGASSGVYPRLEMETLKKDPYQWSLFMQAMRNIQQKGYKPTPASWQEIGGIHGIPYSRWSGDPNGPSQPDDNIHPDPDHPGQQKLQWQGYCYHSSVLFPTWHRVYMLLIEQSLTEEAKKIVAGIAQGSISPSEQQNWTNAAMQLRLPFWDWSAQPSKSTGLPLLFMEPVSNVQGPAGTTIRLDPNPLSQFILNEIPADSRDVPTAGAYFAEWKRTYRWAKPATPGVLPIDPQNIVEDYDKLNKALLHGLSPSEAPPLGPPFIPISSMCDKLRRMFSYPAEADQKMWATYYDYFAGTAPQSANNAPPNTQQSLKTLVALEDPHNSIHLDTGGSGSMGFDETASFDPLFFFHHCNVDRQQAFWEYCYPDYWLGQGYYDINTGEGPKPFLDRDGAYQSVPATPFITENTALPPFRKSEGEYWTSTDVRGPKSVLKTYTYPPMVINVRGRTITIDISKPATPSERKVYIAALQAYYADLSAPLPSNPNDAKPALPPIFHHPPSPSDAIPPGIYTPLAGYRDFIVLACLPQYAFPGSHRLTLSIASQPINELSVFSRLNPEKCAKCAGRVEAGAAFVRGAMGVPHAAVLYVLEREGCNTGDVGEEVVVKAIGKWLSARIVAADGTLLAVHSAAGEGGEGGEGGARRAALTAEQRPSLELVSSRVAVSRRGTDTLVPDLPFDWRDHGAVLAEGWFRA